MNSSSTPTPTSGCAHVYYYEGPLSVGSRDVYCCGASDAEESFSAHWPNIAYFCPKCGEIWGRAVYVFQFTYSPRVDCSWVVEIRRCAKHGDGTFLVGQSLEYCTTPLLLREFLLLSKEY